MLDKKRFVLKSLLPEVTIQSMTGFVSKNINLDSQKDNKTKLSITIRSLNSRYLDVSCKLPYVLNQFETDLIKLLKTKLDRGQIYLSIYLIDPTAFKSSVKASMPTISSYIETLETIKKEFNLTGEISIKDILNLPDIFIPEEKNIDENSKQIIFDTIEELIIKLIDERKKEGLELQKDIEQRIILMHQHIINLSIIFEKTLDEQKEKISKKINQINIDNENSAEIQRQSLYLLLDKIDIHEEIVRFKSHLKNLSELINSKSIEKGRQLDFTLQELSREINTITAKTQVAQISELAISIKVEIEKAREQAQNIV